MRHPSSSLVTNSNDYLTKINKNNSTVPIIDYFVILIVVFCLSWNSFGYIHSEFWVCTSTEAQNQPQILVDDVPYSELYFFSFDSSFIDLVGKIVFLIPIVVPSSISIH